jgi:hypothetical protein
MKVTKNIIPKALLLTRNHKHPGRAPFRRRFLGNQLLRQLVIEIENLQRCQSSEALF